MTTFMSLIDKRTRLLQLLLLFTSFFIKKAYAVDGCRPQSAGTPGFDMNLYHYPYAYTTTNAVRSCFNNEYQTPEFQQGGYQTYGGGLFGSAYGIEDVTLSIRLTEICTETNGSLPSNFNYPETFSISNFTMLLTGYFLPHETGQYIFTLDADDLAYLSFGAGNAFDCCDEQSTVSNPDAFDLVVIWNGADDMSGSITYELEAGIYYPIRLLYANRDFHGDLKLSFQDPTGNIFTNFSNHIYQFPDEPKGCPNNIVASTTQWTGSYTTTYSTSIYTTTGTDGIPTIETLYMIQTPNNTYTSTATTKFTEGTGDITTTYSTATGVITGTDGIITTETTYFVETPRSETTAATSSTTSQVEHITNDEEMLTISKTTIVTGTTKFGTVTAPTIDIHVTTYYSTVEDGNVIEVVETSIEVEIPNVEKSTTIVKTTTTFGTVTAPTTTTSATTYYSTYEDGDVVEVVETDIEIELPNISKSTTIVKTTTTFGTVTAPTTTTAATTYYSTAEDGNVVEVVETDIEIELPNISKVSTTTNTIYTKGDVTEPSTISTMVTTYYTTDADGNEDEVIETLYVVEIPDASKTIETAITEYTEYPGTVTITTTHIKTYVTTNADGDEEEVIKTDIIIETPDNPHTNMETITTSSTIVTYYTGSEVSTYSTSIRTYTTTDAHGNSDEVIETDYYVEIPEPTSKATEYVTNGSTSVTTVTETSSTIPNVSEYPMQTPSSTLAGLSEFHGVGVAVSNNIFSFIVGLLFTILLV
ncbi:similar to Saccharomyces cerevisiae YHR211W FLO5 Lectin-like cell wall protein (flocculin) involved in flocculation [Maudiozyma saulgeensis]|uniref:Similar to Saccharomyces cerevisiae YHR211W FLO5 Lectin-like cell wall protein (Flocculin) involved in flocculation n=1 Tax=Maudiozyma saulgeensis TaxID=1789683 RepID=A0A1X7R6Z5_9SACH|nr:similar to Saccharomyces cerevisiae YHR211W FLO5 Lectin-like cell wall protein (flocculin) involved in flocculation [Kazachstania saulgeensis]